MRVEELKKAKGSGKWSERIVANDDFSVTVIHQPPGTPNDHHYHLKDETWFIFEGELTWQYEHHPEPVHVKAGDWVFAPRGLWHHIEPIGDGPTIRIAVTPGRRVPPLRPRGLQAAAEGLSRRPLRLTHSG